MITFRTAVYRDSSDAIQLTVTVYDGVRRIAQEERDIQSCKLEYDYIASLAYELQIALESELKEKYKNLIN